MRSSHCLQSSQGRAASQEMCAGSMPKGPWPAQSMQCTPGPHGPNGMQLLRTPGPCRSQLAMLQGRHFPDTGSSTSKAHSEHCPGPVQSWQPWSQGRLQAGKGDLGSRMQRLQPALTSARVGTHVQKQGAEDLGSEEQQACPACFTAKHCLLTRARWQGLHTGLQLGQSARPSSPDKRTDFRRSACRHHRCMAGTRRQPGHTHSGRP